MSVPEDHFTAALTALASLRAAVRLAAPTEGGRARCRARIADIRRAVDAVAGEIAALEPAARFTVGVGNEGPKHDKIAAVVAAATEVDGG